MVAGAEVADVIIFDGTEGILLEVTPDPDTWPRIHDAWDEFMHFVATAQAPPLTDRDTRVRDDPDWLEAAAAYLELRTEYEMLGAKYEEAKANLVGLASHAREQGGGLSVTRMFKRGSIDYKCIPALKNLDLEQYRVAAREEVRVTTTR